MKQISRPTLLGLALATGLSLLVGCGPEPDFLDKPAQRRTLFANSSSCNPSDEDDEDPIDGGQLGDVFVYGHLEPDAGSGYYDTNPTGGPCIICGGGTTDPGGYEEPPSGDGGTGGWNGYNPGPTTTSAAATFDSRIDGQNLQPCMASILAQIKSINNGQIGFIVQGFSGQIPDYNWTLQNGSLSANTYGSTSSALVNHSVVTTFDASLFVNASDLSVARTIMHESVHAYLVASFENDRLLAQAAYPDLVQAWLASKHPDLNSLQHDQMVGTLVQEIAYGLLQYGQAKGYNLSNDFYINMAWGGLEGTRAFQNLSTAQKQQIRDTILGELTGQDSSGNSVTKKGNPSGC